MGGRGFGMGRKLASADLQLLILELLNEKSSYGYEIIKELEERSNGFYVPSPGMVYPALTYIEEIGHATVEAVGARKQYTSPNWASSTWKPIEAPPKICSRNSAASASAWAACVARWTARTSAMRRLPNPGGAVRRNCIARGAI